MLGPRLFLHAVRAVIDELPAALRLSLLPYLGVVAAVGWLEASYGDVTALAPAGDGPPSVPPGLLLGTLALIAANLLMVSWVAVGWHRYRLLDEAPRGWVPRLEAGRVLRYLGYSILVALAVGLIALGAGTVAAVLLLPLFGPAAQIVVVGVMLMVALVLFYRLGLILPAVATGRSMGFGEAMRASAGHSRTAVMLSLLTLALAAALEVPPLLDAAAAEDGASGGMGPIAFAYRSVVQWIALMVGVSTLTAFYSHVTGSRPGVEGT